MVVKRNNYAFIDGQNLYQGIKALGWRLDYARFRRLLRERYGVERAFICIGYLPSNEAVYTHLRNAGFICIFKPILEIRGGIVKGNVDAELVLHCMIEYPQYEKAVIVSGDGDFRCLAEYLLAQDKLCKILIPNRLRYSSLLKSLSSPDNNVLDFIENHRRRLEKS